VNLHVKQKMIYKCNRTKEKTKDCSTLVTCLKTESVHNRTYLLWSFEGRNLKREPQQSQEFQPLSSSPVDFCFRRPGEFTAHAGLSESGALDGKATWRWKAWFESPMVRSRVALVLSRLVMHLSVGPQNSESQNSKMDKLKWYRLG